MQTRRPHPIGEYLALFLQATMNSSNLSLRHLVLNWLSERGEYSKAARSASLRKQDSTLRALSIFCFLISVFYLCNSTMVIAFPPWSSVSNECFSTNGCEARNSLIPLRSAPVPCP